MKKLTLLKILNITCAIFISTLSFAITNNNNGDCDIDCPGNHVVEADINGNYTVPDFFANGVVGFTPGCAGGSFFQTPEPGTVLAI